MRSQEKDKEMIASFECYDCGKTFFAEPSEFGIPEDEYLEKKVAGSLVIWCKECIDEELDFIDRDSQDIIHNFEEDDEDF